MQPGGDMNDLLDSAAAAHGGMDKWNQVKSISVDASITGAVWSVKNQGDALKDVRFEVDTTRERLTMDFVGQDRQSVFEPDRVEIRHSDGGLIDARDEPEKAFEGHQFETPWDDLHLVYFVGEALVDVSEYAVPLHLARVRHRGDRPSRGRRRNVAAPQRDVP